MTGPDDVPGSLSPRFAWFGLLAGWSGLGVVAAALVWARRDGAVPLSLALLIHVPHWTAWAVLTQGVRAFHRRTGVQPGWGAWPLHIAVGAAVVLTHSAWVATWDFATLAWRWPLSWTGIFVAHLQQSGAVEAMGYFAILGAALLAGGFRGRDAPTTIVPAGQDTEPVVVVRQGPAEVRIPVARIRFLEAAGNYVRVHADSGRYAVRGTLGSVAAGLGAGFLRAHRSRVVNLAHVDRLESRGRRDKRIVLRDGTVVGASPDGWRILSAALGPRIDAGGDSSSPGSG